MHNCLRIPRRRLAGLAALVIGAVFQLGFLETCDNSLANVTRVFDPCGTIFANCTPGTFFANNVEIGSDAARCFDPTCTIPGQCGPPPPLGTIRDGCN